MHYRKAYMYLIFSQIELVGQDQSKPYTQIYLQKKCKLPKFATTNSNFENINLFRHVHYKRYMYINFQQNWAKRSVIIVHTN